MVKIINGRMYDTSTAEVIGEYLHQEYMCTEILYRKKKTGEYFIAAEADLYDTLLWNEKYKAQNSSNLLDGTVFFAITDDFAKKWVEQKLSAEAYIAIFGPVQE